MREEHIHSWWVQDWDAPDWRKAWAQLMKDVPIIIDKSGIALNGPSGDASTERAVMIDRKKGIAFKGALGITQDTFEFLPVWATTYCPAGLAVDTVCSVNTGGHPYDAVVTCILLRAWELGQDNFDVGSKIGYAGWQPGRMLYKSIWPDDDIDMFWGGGGNEEANLHGI